MVSVIPSPAPIIILDDSDDEDVQIIGVVERTHRSTRPKAKLGPDNSPKIVSGTVEQDAYRLLSPVFSSGPNPVVSNSWLQARETISMGAVTALFVF